MPSTDCRGNRMFEPLATATLVSPARVFPTRAVLQLQSIREPALAVEVYERTTNQASECGQLSDTDPAANRALMAQLVAGDPLALAELYDLHGSMVYSLAMRILGQTNDAEEVVQEVFTQVWRQAERYDPSRATVEGWLLMMTRARALDAVRARSARPDTRTRVALPDLPSAQPGQDALVLTSEAVSQLRLALGALDEPLRVPIELAYYEGLSQREIAERLAQPLGTVKTRMRTALTRLRTSLWAEDSR